jgi:hypothetical protein
VIGGQGGFRLPGEIRADTKAAHIAFGREIPRLARVQAPAQADERLPVVGGAARIGFTPVRAIFLLRSR